MFPWCSRPSVKGQSLRLCHVMMTVHLGSCVTWTASSRLLSRTQTFNVWTVTISGIYVGLRVDDLSESLSCYARVFVFRCAVRTLMKLDVTQVCCCFVACIFWILVSPSRIFWRGSNFKQSAAGLNLSAAECVLVCVQLVYAFLILKCCTIFLFLYNRI